MALRVAVLAALACRLGAALAPTPRTPLTKLNAATMEPLVAETDIAPPPALALRSSALRRLPGGGTAPTVWSEFGDLARRVDASGAFDGGVANLGQGFPDWAPPQFVKTAARRAASDESPAGHQYARSAGHIPLVHVLARRYSNHIGRDVDALSEVAVTVGATQALLVSLLATLAAGDEVVIPEPFFDLYLGQIKLAEGVARPAPMAVDGDGEWRLTEDVLRGAITPKSRVLVVNSPHNPTGKVFDRDELEMIARVVREENARRERDRVGDEDDALLVIADEVYKYITHDADADHVHFASLPGMRDVTLTVSSAGKTFSATGWQIGWIVGPARLVAPCQTLLPYLQFCAPTPMQAALADCLDEADRPHKGQPSYYAWLRVEYARKRQVLAAALEAACIAPLPSRGGYFVVGDVSSLLPLVPDRYRRPNGDAVAADWAFCQWLAAEHGVVAIPASPFFTDAPERPLVRFAFCKTDAVLAVAAERLAAIAAMCQALPEG